MRGEEFQRQHADIVQGIGDLAGKLARFGDLRRDRLACGKMRGGQNPAAMFVAGRIPEADFALLAAHEDDRKLGLELDEGFVDAGRVGHVERFRLTPVGNAPLALAVIAVTPGLEDTGRAQPVRSGDQVVA